jgi:protein-disulfide isomerase
LTKSKIREANVTTDPPRAGQQPEFPSPRTTRLAVVGGLAALVVLAALIWQQSRRIEQILDARLGQLDDRLEKVASRVGQAAAPPQRGPDPNKVYAVKTEGAPARGPANAPVTIAEFSDFQ